MSGPARPPAAADDPALDDGLLAAGPVLEFHGHAAVSRHGGVAVLPWRAAWLAARAEGVAAVPHAGEMDVVCAQAVVRIQKGRDATQADLDAAIAHVPAGGRIVVTGPNTLGPATWEKRAAALFGPPVLVVTRAKARAAAFIRPAGIHHASATAPDGSRPPLGSPPTAGAGLFNGGAIDPGTAALLAVVAGTPGADDPRVDLVAAARAAVSAVPDPLVLDLGCGAGHLGFAALAAWPAARAVLLDADARAVTVAVQRAAVACGGRAAVHWWDADEDLPAMGPVTLALTNPPAHAGVAVDLGAARRMFRAAVAALAPHGLLLVVANRHLPYEADLAALGTLRVASAPGGFKILSVSRR